MVATTLRTRIRRVFVPRELVDCEMRKLLTVDELSEALGVPRSTIYRWVHYDFIPHIKLGRAVRFDEASVWKWVKRRERPGRLRLRPDVTHMIPPKR